MNLFCTPYFQCDMSQHKGVDNIYTLYLYIIGASIYVWI